MVGWSSAAAIFVDGEVAIFAKEKWLQGELWEELEEIDVYLVAEPGRLQILDRDTKDPLNEISWDDVRRLTCSCSRYLRARQLVFMLNLFNLPHLPLHGKKHWLELEHGDKKTMLRLQKKTRNTVVKEFEEKTGLQCERIGLE